ncbi:MAG: ATP-dependent zinc metalloprotease FtsH [Ruminococcaceae bacterium]|nr:ATP-dependent zinc metalloprotease FtsH [Oscillospiraceae bacterium]
MKSNFKLILGYLLAAAVLIGALALFYQGTTAGQEKITEADFVDALVNENVAVYTLDYNKGYLVYQEFVKTDDGSFVDVKGVAHTIPLDAEGNPDYSVLDEVELKLSDPKKIKLADISASRLTYIDKLALEQAQAGTGVGILDDYDNKPANSFPWWVSILPALLIVVALIALYVFAMRKMMNGGGPGGARTGGFGKAHVKMPTDDKNKVTFRDVAGADEEKEELVEIVDYLKSPTKFARLGARIPHGVLLMGPPGTGKTLLAKAVAGEAGVPFFSISGSDFVEMYVGVGASRVRDLFDTARKAGSAIIFIDEIDAVGRQRGTGLGGGHDEREQTLNQLLVEMDGFGSHEGIVVIAATNRADVLDPALLRPGRFDRQITVNRPNIKGREDILKVHARNKPLEPGVDLAKVAKITVGFTGADLANLLNEAALLSARHGKSLIGMDEIEAALNKIIMGPKKKTNVMNDQEKKNTAYHEAGHAVVGYLVGCDPVHMITIVPTGRGALGYTSFRPEADRYQKYKQEYKNDIAMTLGGRAAEEIIFGDVTSGAYSDIQSATATAKRMVTLFGMSDKLGPRRFGSDQNEVFLGRDFSSNADYSEAIAAVIDDEIHAIIDEAYIKAKALLTGSIDKLHFIADYLLSHEDMDGDQFKAVMENASVTVEMIEAIAAEKEKASREANEARKAAEEARKAKEEAEKAADEAGNEPSDGESNEDANKNPFDYSPENNGGKNPFDYSNDDKKD